MLSIPRRWVSWQSAKILSVGLAVLLAFFFLFVWRLGTIVPALSAHEAVARIASSSFGDIVNNPVNAPHKIIQCFFQLLDYHGAFWMRSVSVFYAAIFLASLYLLLKIWFGRFIAAAGTLLFATTPWVVLMGRNAAPDIMWLSPFLFMFAYASLCRSETRVNIAWFIFLVSVVLCVYTPGLIWLVLFAFIIRAKKITAAITKINGSLIVAGLSVLILLLLPLVYAAVRDTAVAKNLLLIPSYFTGTTVVIQNFLWTGTALAYHLPQHMDYSVGRLPILDLGQTVLAVFGILALWQKARRETLIVLALILISVVTVAFSGNMLLLVIALPAIAVLDAAGLRYLYIKWFKVFPINPIARAFATCLVSLLLLAHIAYGIRFALLAWPHNVETRKAYVVK
jgi:hypothetical protein